jgi:hypothetical protein
MKKLFTIILLLYLSISSNAQTITELGFFASLPSTFEMTSRNNYLFITQQGLKVFDVSNPSAPQQVGSAPYPGAYAYQIALNGNYVYLAEGGSGYFSVYNITNPLLPVLAGFVVIPSTSFVTGGDLLVTDSTAYMTGFDSLYIVNVATPSAPDFISAMQVVDTSFGSASSLAVNENSLFVLHSLGIAVYDISSAWNPVVLDTIPKTHAYHNGLTVDTINDRLFSPWLSALQTHLGFDAYDISNPSSPVFLFSDSIPFLGGEYGITDYYSNLLVISNGGGVHMFDVSATTHGYITSFSGTNVANSTVSVEFRDSVFYNARRGGFEILQYNGGFPTSVDHVSSIGNEIIVYPNPATGSFTIQSKMSADIRTELKIVDAVGRIVFEQLLTSPSHQINYPFAPGIYLLKVSDGEKMLTKKLVVQ